jgi:hypothetical protein
MDTLVSELLLTVPAQDSTHGSYSHPLARAIPRGVDFVAAAQLADRLRQIVADRAFGQVRVGGDVRAGLAVNGKTQDLTLAGVSRSGSDQASEANSGSTAVTAVDASDRVGGLVWRGVLEEIPGGAGFERAAQVAGLEKVLTIRTRAGLPRR